ncbi:hypothetical protein N657DRAFT_678669 [Parathielavia appendiculata]|uniref:F-box domain-containing protein n=1 Tax=Parathielavia appendiculata TaxID=2587402 RepID=A0AAN6Z534_9PEZI|nr:hypothetical protein N657DRAFT_678669 [Parathielavia appendiculata]
MASLGTLPPEVFNLIARVLADGHCERSLAALAASCRGFYEIVMPHLYHQVVERHPALLHWAAYYGRLSTAQRLIEAGVSVDTGMLWDSSGAEPKSFWNFEAFCAYAGKTPRKVYRAIQGRLKDGNIVMCQIPSLRQLSMAYVI